MTKPFELADLAGLPEIIKIRHRKYPIKGPGEFRLVPLARLSLAIERLYDGLKVEKPDLFRAESRLYSILEEICPRLVADKVFYRQLTLEEKLEVLAAFHDLYQKLAGSDGQEMPVNPEVEVEPPEPTDWFKVIPRLQQFYRGSPLDWFQLKLKWLIAFNDQMESLKAEHILNMSQAHLIGSWPQSEEQRDAIEEMTHRLEAIVMTSDSQVPSQDEIIDALGKIGFSARRVDAESE